LRTDRKKYLNILAGNCDNIVYYWVVARRVPRKRICSYYSRLIELHTGCHKFERKNNTWCVHIRFLWCFVQGVYIKRWDIFEVFVFLKCHRIAVVAPHQRRFLPETRNTRPTVSNPNMWQFEEVNVPPKLFSWHYFGNLLCFSNTRHHCTILQTKQKFMPKKNRLLGL
jgi:hypothetical protein